ncbi:MAG: 3-deoxy-manno-octulosonate cytidylyltransferase [Nitrospirae bacterium]|nr:3-deoxy-manno-octulosonate cytidylyltransferase [Nitrospirota bacterium]MBF0541696.1 3-deoxy-manno-octulosonate cytidylyltransferase [Nitrospirota bacterium]
MNIIGIIPARMASTRCPGKPLAMINNIPMIGHVYYRSAMCRTLNDIYVATCDIEIKEYIESIGGKAIMTADTHERATDRTSEAMLKIEKSTGKHVDIVVMIQGDEPMMLPDMIDDAIAPIKEDPEIQVVNLSAPLKTEEEHNDPNEVKVVVDQQGFALYFSREPIPSRKKGGKNIPMLKQVCIIPFRRDFLIKFNQLKPTPLEIIESVDMLRVMEHGYKVKMVYKEYQTYSVDTMEDLKRVEQLMKNDMLVKLYPIKGK